jgi:hypothetical protein
MIPATNNRLLPQHAAAYSVDAYLYKGELIGWRKPKALYNLKNSTTRRAYRIPQNLALTKITDPSYWLEFDDVDTDVIRSPVVDDAFSRYYFASPSDSPQYNTLARIAAGQDPWLLGIPTPGDRPIVSPGGGGLGQPVTRSYVYTWVSSYGEEGPPSPATVQNGFSDDTWAISVDAPASSDLGINRTIATVRIYRTVTSSTGTASYFMVTEQAATLTTFADTLSDQVVALNSQLQSTTWSAPPDDLEGFTLMPNGMFIGWRNHEIWFSEPFRPHAWPPNYVLTTDFPIVGIGVTAQSAIVATTGYPYVVTGINPSAATATTSRIVEPCNSKGSIVSTPGAVYYTSPNGLISVDPSGSTQNVSVKLLLREDWKAQTPPISIRAAQVGPAYMAFGSVFFDASDLEDNATYSMQGFTIDLSTEPDFSAGVWTKIPQTAFGVLTSHTGYSILNFWADPWTAVPLLMANQQVFYYDFQDTDPTYVPFRWRSKIVQMGKKQNFGAMRLWWSVPDTTTPHEVTRTTTPGMSLIPGMYGVVRVFVSADGSGSDADQDTDSMTLLTDRDMFQSGELLRIASGQKYEFWQFEIEGYVRVFNLQVASTVKELAEI